MAPLLNKRTILKGETSGDGRMQEKLELDSLNPGEAELLLLLIMAIIYKLLEAAEILRMRRLNHSSVAWDAWEEEGLQIELLKVVIILHKELPRAISKLSPVKGRHWVENE